MSLLSKFILKNLKRNRSVYLIYVELNFVNFVDTLTIISNRIEKHCTRPRHPKTVSYDITLKLILQSPIKMAPCYYYKNKGFICLSCPSHSDHYFKCVHNNQLYYDVRDLSILQLRKIATQYSKAESKLTRVEKE